MVEADQAHPTRPPRHYQSKPATRNHVPSPLSSQRSDHTAVDTVRVEARSRTTGICRRRGGWPAAHGEGHMQGTCKLKLAGRNSLAQRVSAGNCATREESPGGAKAKQQHLRRHVARCMFSLRERAEARPILPKILKRTERQRTQRNDLRFDAFLCGLCGCSRRTLRFKVLPAWIFSPTGASAS